MSRASKYVTDRLQMSAVDSQNYIAQQVRSHDYDRYFSTLFCPAECRLAIFALYAFNIEIATIRETVSEPLIGQMRLQWWRDTIGAIYDGQPIGHPVAAALADAVASCELAREPFDRMINGREFDLSDEPRDELTALESYTDATSSNLVRLVLTVLGARGADAEQLAHHAGLAWGLAGILRAVPFHSTQRFQTPSIRKPRNIATSAQRHLDSVQRIQIKLPRRAIGAILPVACVQPYLQRLARAGGDPSDRGLELSRLTRQWRMTMSALRARI